MNRKLLFWLALLAIGGLLAYRVAGGDFNWTLFASSLSNVNIGWAAASITFSILSYLLRAARWRALLASLKPIPLSNLFWATITGFSAIYVLGRTAELARPLWLARREHVPFSTAIATILVERFLDFLMLIAVFAGALMVIELPPESAGVLSSLKNAAWFIAAIATAAMGMLFLMRSRVESLAGWFRQVVSSRAAAAVEDFARGLHSLGSVGTLARVVVCSAALWIVIAVQSWLMFFAMDLRFSLEAATLVMVATAIGSVAQIPAIGGGFQLAWIFCMTTFFSMPGEQAAATAIIAFVLSYVPAIAVAAVYMLAQGISMRELSTTARPGDQESLSRP